MAIETNQRIHGIDALRAIAMLLGIVLHATIAYKSIALPNWPHDAGFHHWGFDFIYSVIHSFRMPLFYLIAGYFCRFLYYKAGEKSFIRHRWKRIGIPFFLSVIIILPFTIFPFLVYNFSLQYPGDWDTIFSLSFRQLFHWNGMAHLWFLYYLLIFYVFIILLQRLRYFSPVNRVLINMAAWWQRANPANILWLIIASIPVWLTLLPEKELYLNVDTGFIPEFYYPAFFGYFFVLGWMIHIKQGIFNLMVKNTWPLIGTGLALGVGLFYFEYRWLPLHPKEWILYAAKGLAAVQIVLMVFGCIGFFLKYFISESRVWKYISDASYWMYLLHLGLVAGLQVLLSYSSLPGWGRFPLILVITAIVTLVTYQMFIRYTFIGEYLHGKRKRE